MDEPLRVYSRPNYSTAPYGLYVVAGRNIFDVAVIDDLAPSNSVVDLPKNWYWIDLKATDG